MGALEHSLHAWWVFLLVLTRLGGLTLTAPAVLGQYAPIPIRVVLAVLLAALVAPVCCQYDVPQPQHVLELGVMLIREALLGLFVGWSLLVFFSALQVAGRLVSHLAGSQLAELYDATADTGTPFVARLLELLAVSIFLTMNGHHQVLSAMLGSFRSVPPGASHWLEGFSEAILEATCQSFEVGLRAAAPLTVAILFSLLILGIVGRTLPQLNMLAVGFSLNTLVLLGVLCLSAGSVAWFFQSQAESFIGQLRQQLVGP